MHGALSLSAVSRVLALAEFKLVYRGPAREGSKLTTTNAGRLLHRSRNQFVVNHSQELPEIGNKVATSYKLVTWLCALAVLHFILDPRNSTPPCVLSCTAKDILHTCFEIFSSFCSYICTKFINLLGIYATPNRPAIKGRTQCTPKRYPSFWQCNIYFTFLELHMHESRVFGSMMVAQKRHSSLKVCHRSSEQWLGGLAKMSQPLVSLKDAEKLDHIRRFRNCPVYLTDSRLSMPTDETNQI